MTPRAPTGSPPNWVSALLLRAARPRPRRGRARRARATPPAPEERAEKTSRTGGFLRRTLGFGLPVAAFAAAFILGVASRPHKPAPAQLATASSHTGASATVAKVSPVPTPSKLVVVKHHGVHKTKPKAVHRTPATTHSTSPTTPAAGDPTASPPPSAPAHGTTTTSSGSGGSSVSTNGTGTASGTG